VVVTLSDSVAVALMIANALSVGRKDTGIGIGVGAFEPIEQGWAEIETDARVIVDDPLNASPIVGYAGERIGPVTLSVYSLVPVMKGARAPFAVEGAGPRILARRLIEVAVDDD
jgi:hypothetical protein